MPGDTIAFSYDELGRRVSTAINGVASSVTYDAAGRIATSTNALGVFTNTFDGDSFRMTSQSYPNGQTVEFGYAGNLQDQHLQRITHRLGETPISEFLYGRDVPTGRITSWSQQAGTETASIYDLGYDDGDQLTSASLSEGGNVVKTFGYSYDPAGNRLTEQIDAATRHFYHNALNELTSVEGGDAGPAATYQRDAEQRLSSVNGGPGDRVHLRWTWAACGHPPVDNARKCRIGGSCGVTTRSARSRRPGGACQAVLSQGVKVEIGAAVGGIFLYERSLGFDS